ncbi:MAG: hypothetical protein AAF481_14500 [Acidobacteriota bacterium]
MARPRHPNPRDECIPLRLTVGEAERLAEAAQLHMLPVSVYARRRALSLPVAQRVSSRAVVELGRVGTNLQQLLRVARRDQNTHLEDELREVLAEVTTAVERLLEGGTLGRRIWEAVLGGSDHPQQA